MREWRRTLKSWPEEASRTADPASMSAALRDPARLAEARRQELRWSLVGIGIGTLIPMSLMFAGAFWISAAGYETLATVVGIGGMALGIVGLFPAAKVADERKHAQRQRRALDVLEARGDATLGGEFVGVAYGNGLWHHPDLGHDVDEGVLTLDFDRLAFVGRASRFEIPKVAILGTEIRVFPTAITGPQPRLYVAYAHEGGTGTLSFAVPYRRSAQRRVEEAAGLKDRLDAWRTERLPSLATRPFVAPPAGDYTVAAPVRPVGLPAKLLAVPATVLLLGTIEAMATAVAIAAGWPRTGGLLSSLFALSWVVWSMLAAVIDRRLPERYRDWGKASNDVRDALHGVAARSETIPVSDEIKVR